MNESRIFEGKTSTQAIEKGLKELGVSKEDVEIKILESEEKRSFFSILEPRTVKVKFTLKEKDPKEIEKSPKIKKEIDTQTAEIYKNKIEGFLSNFFKAQNYGKVDYKVYYDKTYIYVDINGDNTSYLIGYRGEVLNSLQTILNCIIRNENIDKVKVILNVSGYKEKRKKSLEELAEKISKTVIRTGKKITLEPMPAYERKIIHSKLQNNPKVTTESIGEEPNRKIVIFLKK